MGPDFPRISIIRVMDCYSFWERLFDGHLWIFHLSSILIILRNAFLKTPKN